MLPPSASKRPHEITRHGDVRVDPYYWLMDRDDPEVLALLAAENQYWAERRAPLKAVEDQLFAEIKARVEETDISVPVRRGAWWYFERTREGLSYPISCRVPVGVDELEPPVIDPLVTLEDEQVILDENVEAVGHDYLSVGVFAVSPDDRWVAVGTDVDGDELHRVTIRPLGGQGDIDDVLDDVHYGFAWSAQSTHVFFTRVDEAMRPWQLWRHEVGTDATNDVLVYEERDAQYSVTVGRTRDESVMLLIVGSSMTTEVHSLDANDPLGQFEVVEPRRHGIEYGLDHYTDADGRAWWLKVTNEDAADFRLVVRRHDETEWREVIAHRPGCRLDGVEVFSRFLALSERLDGSAAVRIVSLHDGEDPFGHDLLEHSRLVDGGATPSTVYLSANANYVTTHVRVVATSLITPRLVADVDAATGEVIVRKQQRVLGGYDSAQYATTRLWVRASDDVRVPVSIVARRDLIDERPDGTLRPRAPRPLLLYGYGSYEVCIDPAFSSLQLSLLERGVVFAIAHVRGGGEMGRAWYEMGRLAQKPTTFSDFVATARHLVDEGWTTPDQLAARGGSAGGLLMGAVMNLAPELFTAVVAEVPFVDALTTMLDASLPLTVGEWEEWGNPDASASAYRTMKGYSPYDNVRSTNDDSSPRVYPHLYATGGLNDPRVGFWEPAKFVQRLRDANAENVAFLSTDMGPGHSGPSGRYDAWRDEARIFAWLLDEIDHGSTVVDSSASDAR